MRRTVVLGENPIGRDHAHGKWREHGFRTPDDHHMCLTLLNLRESPLHDIEPGSTAHSQGAAHPGTANCHGHVTGNGMGRNLKKSRRMNGPCSAEGIGVIVRLKHFRFTHRRSETNANLPGILRHNLDMGVGNGHLGGCNRELTHSSHALGVFRAHIRRGLKSLDFSCNVARQAHGLEQGNAIHARAPCPQPLPVCLLANAVGGNDPKPCNHHTRLLCHETVLLNRIINSWYIRADRRSGSHCDTCCQGVHES